MTRRAAVRKSEIERAVSAVLAAGLEVGRVDVDPISGKFSVVPKGATSSTGNPWDELHR